MESGKWQLTQEEPVILSPQQRAKNLALPGPFSIFQFLISFFGRANE
jgi:hypothetical protein